MDFLVFVLQIKFGSKDLEHCPLHPANFLLPLLVVPAAPLQIPECSRNMTEIPWPS